MLKEATMWDYIIVGAGSAGCALANRLSADPRNKVLLLEAGGPADALRYKIPALSLGAVANPDSDWMFLSDPDPTRKDRQSLMSRGKVLGGSSSINGTIYVRGNRGDYDYWAQLGNAGWDYDSLLTYFRRIEKDNTGSSPIYGGDGPIRISPTRGAPPLAHAFIEAMKERGVPSNPNYNGPEQAGAAITHVNQNRGWRWGSARGYLDPIRGRSNLSIQTGAFVRRIIIENRRAVGVEIDQDGERIILRCAGEVIISSSAYNSPKLLMLSGIGDAEHLNEHGIAVVHANKFVGQNLHDHPYTTVKAYVSVRTGNMDYNLWGKIRHGSRFGVFGSGPATYIFPAVSFVKLRSESEYPDLQFHFGAFAADVTEAGVRMLERPAITLQPNVNRSRSRGYVKLRSANPMDPPVIQPNMLDSRYDLETLIAGVRFARSLLTTKALGQYVQSEFAPGVKVESDAELEDYVRSTASLCYHASGSVKMGIDDAAVVDPRLRVIGVERLRVIDSSVIPQVPSGNTNAISMVIGEKGADMILEDHRVRSAA